MTVDPGYFIASLFTFFIFCMVIVGTVPQLRVLLTYGKTLSPQSSNCSLIDLATSLTVPKSFFTHYYIFFTLNLLVLKLTIIGYKYTDYIPIIDDVNYELYSIFYWFYILQAIRRFSESIFVFNYGENSKMNVSHYILGIGYYLVVSSNAILSLVQYENSPSFEFNLLNWKIVLPFVIFSLASIDQTLNHIHLALLVKYTNPSKGLFKYIDCPHYFDEIIIYSTFPLTILLFKGLQSWNIYDINLVLDWLFVITILSISSHSSHKFYQKKFDDYKQRWCIFPGIF